MKRLLIILFISASLLSCSPSEIVQNTFETDLDINMYINNIQLIDYIAKPTIAVPDGTLFYKNVPYGNNQKQVVDIFIPYRKSESIFEFKNQKSVVLNIHGGGFRAGDKTSIYNTTNDIYNYLENDIVFISMNYRFIEDNNPDYYGVLKSFNDSENVIKFIEYLATITSINPNSLILKGESAGAGLAQYIISNPYYNSKVKAISLNAPQATYDFLKYNSLFSEFNFELYEYLSITNLENEIINFYGGSNINQLENDAIIVGNRSKIALTNIYTTYNGNLRLVSGNVGLPYSSFNNLNEILHHQIHAIDILNRAIEAGVYVDAEIPSLNILNNQSELDFILESLE